MDKVVVAMSGGVDSSTAAYLLKKAGYLVEGVFFILFDGYENIEFARETARFIGIKLHIQDLRASFKEKVIEPFFEGYKRGITPNPCVLCNKFIKFPTLKKVADRESAKYFATGHYARIIRESDKAFLLKGIDKNKDQSYFLYAIDRSFLNQLIFPLGEYTKKQVKTIAEKINIPSVKAQESNEVCFLREKRYYQFIRGNAGPIIESSTGKIVGQHKGIHLFTIGQRKRIGVALGYPAYVVKIDPAVNAVYVASKELAFMKEFYVEKPNWLADPPDKSFYCEVKIRYAMIPQRALVSIEGEKIKVSFDEPQFAPTPGQSAVFYDGEKVLGGGVIKELMQDS